MNDDSSTAKDAGGSGANDFQHPNDLETELTPEAEQAFIDETLGLKGGKDDESQDKSGEESQADAEADKDTEAEKAGDGSDADDSAGDSDSQAAEAGQADASADDAKGSKTEPEDKESEKPPQTDENSIKVDDLWLEIENADGKSVKLIYDPQNPASFLPEDFVFKNDKQLFEILDAKAEMANLYKERSSQFDAETKATNEKAAAEKATADRNAGWDAEIENLVAAGLLDEPKAKPGDKDFMEDPAVQRIDAVFKWMGAHNTKLREEGKTQISSFGTALSLMNKAEAEKTEAEETKQKNAETKRKGALVGGTSAATAGEKKVYKAGSHANIWDVPVDL